MRDKFKALGFYGGFDPCGGAGVLADVKTAERFRTPSLAIISGLTNQNVSSFRSISWRPIEEILAEFEVLSENFVIEVLKVGLIRDVSSTARVIDYLRDNAGLKTVVLDPVSRASVGKEFHKSEFILELAEVLTENDVVTPNLEEIGISGLCGDEFEVRVSQSEILNQLRQKCNVLVKGGHNTAINYSIDLLFQHGSSGNKESESLSVRRVDGCGKHGTGCTYAAALAAMLSRGTCLYDAAVEAQRFVAGYIKTGTDRLGIHHEVSW